MGTTTKPLAEYADMPIIQSNLRAVAEMVGQKAMVRHLEYTDAMMRSRTITFDSPLETLFWLWWNGFAAGNVFYPYDQVDLDHNVEVEAGGNRYRLDFVVVLLEQRWKKALDAGVLVWPKLAIEMDGHHFHERTPEQVARRDRRDRDLQQAGWQVFHFSWSEFTKHPQQCTEEVYDLATSTVSDMYRDYSIKIPTEFHAED